MATDGVIRVEPAVLDVTSESLGNGAEHLLNRLEVLDRQVRDMLGGWQGSSGGAYSSAWQLWHRGASEVQLGLSIMAKLLGQAGVHYADQECRSADALRRVTDA